MNKRASAIIKEHAESSLRQNEKWYQHKMKAKKTLLGLYRRRGKPNPEKMSSGSFVREYELLGQLVCTTFMTERLWARWFRICRERQTRVTCEVLSW